MTEDNTSGGDRAPDGWEHDDWVAYTQLWVEAVSVGAVALLCLAAGYASVYAGIDVSEPVSLSVHAGMVARGLALATPGILLMPAALDRCIIILVARDLRDDPHYYFEEEFFDD